MRQWFERLDASAARSVEQAEFTGREVRLLCGVLLLMCSFLTFGISRGFADPKSEKSLLYFLIVVVGLFWLGAVYSWYWASRWFAHAHLHLPGELDERSLSRGPDAGWASQRRLGWRDLLGLGSFLVVEIGMMAGSIWLVAVGGFHLDPDQPLPFPQGLPCLICMLAAATLAALLGKYLWLWAMSHWLTRAEVVPLIAMGTPRRVTGFDCQVLDRLYSR